jgi:uncharacterized membrane protein
VTSIRVPERRKEIALIKRSFQSIFATWLAGLLMLLPLALTVAVLAWAFTLVNRYLGPASLVGRLSAALGYPFSSNPVLAYTFGILVMIGGIYVLGVLVKLGLKGP